VCTLFGADIAQKNSPFHVKSRKQRAGNFLAFQIYGSKGSYGQNIENMEVAVTLGCCDSVLEPEKPGSMVRLSKILDYLLDN
jgi:hypothetical protein